MATIDDKVTALEVRTGALETRLAALQSPASPLPLNPSCFEKLIALADPIGKVLIPLVVVWMTWFITTSVDSAIKEREVEVTTGTAMQSALTKLLAQKGLTQEDADASALVLASMGKPSIMLLISVYNSGSTEASVAVSKALPILDLTHQTDLCDSLRTIVEDKAGRFRIQTHILAAKHIRSAQCRNNADVLRELKKLFYREKWYAGRFEPDPSKQEVEEFRKEVENALDQLSH